MASRRDGLQGRAARAEWALADARRLVAAKRGPEAIALLRALVQREPGALEAQILLGTLEGMAGELDAAERRLRAALAGDGHSILALNSLGIVLAASGRADEALAFFERVLAAEPGHRGALMNRAKLLEKTRRARRPSTPTRSRTPELLVEDLRRSAPHSGRRAVDLGCGTGLCGALLRPMCAHLAGVDLSERMIEKVVYIGDLAPLWATARRALRPEGWLAFSVEAWPDDATPGSSSPDDAPGYRLGPTRRYPHRSAYLRGWATAHGFSVESERCSALRQQRGVDVIGILFVMRRLGEA